jgi:hypothetical protein
MKQGMEIEATPWEVALIKAFQEGLGDAGTAVDVQFDGEGVEFWYIPKRARTHIAAYAFQIEQGSAREKITLNAALSMGAHCRRQSHN